MASLPIPVVDQDLLDDKSYALLTAAGANLGGVMIHDVLRGVTHTVEPYPLGAAPRGPVSWRPSAMRGGTARIFIGKVAMGRVWDVPALLETLTGCPVLSFSPTPNPKAPRAPATACVVIVRREDADAFASLNQRVLMTTDGVAVVSPTDALRFLCQLQSRDRALEAFIMAKFPERVNKEGRVRKAGQPLTIQLRGSAEKSAFRAYRWNPYAVGEVTKAFLISK